MPRAPSLDGHKRLTYLAIALCLLLVGALRIVLLGQSPQPDLSNLVLNGVVVALSVGVLGALLSGLVRLELIEQVGLGVFVLLALGFSLRLLLPGVALDMSNYGELLLLAVGAAAYLLIAPRPATVTVVSLTGLYLGVVWWRLLSAPDWATVSEQLICDLLMLVGLAFVALLGAHRAAWTQARDSARAMHDIALSDDLTRLPNRRSAYRAFEDAMRSEGTPVCVLLIDIDNFKRVNDTHGHEAGDEVIGEVARTLHSALGKSGSLSRWGGEEYLALLSGVTLTQAGRQAEALRSAVQHLKSPYGPLTVSVGVSSRLPGDSVKTLVHRADQGLYRAKAGGKNRVSQQD
ncbi:GGDEF domain-containing protein [Deinococcus sp.]|uniref:GGDEF domain-containing protein n=1 Tax=Deinococcus sp. TaxID=47478 RepID=UPI0025DEA888|nr:GGDEF domain-containing protein [Deinococcus sp.]